MQGCCLVSKCSAPMFHCLLLDEVNVPTRMFLLAIEHFLISWPWHQEHYLSMTTLVSATHSAGICLQETSLTRTSGLSLDETEHFLHLSAKPDQCSTCVHDLWPDASQASRSLLMFLVLADVLETSSKRQTGNVPGLVSKSTSPLWHDIQFSSWHKSCQPDVPDTSWCSRPFLRILQLVMFLRPAGTPVWHWQVPIHRPLSLIPLLSL